MRIIKAKNGFIIDEEDGISLPILCVNKKELHKRIDELFPGDD